MKKERIKMLKDKIFFILFVLFEVFCGLMALVGGLVAEERSTAFFFIGLGLFVFLIKHLRRVKKLQKQVNPMPIFAGIGGLIILSIVLGTCIAIIKTPSTTPPEQKRKVVSNSPWNASVWQVADYLKRNLKDPKSFEAIEWSEVVKEDSGNFRVRCEYRAKNSFGGYVIANQIFTLDSKGNVIKVVNF